MNQPILDLATAKALYDNDVLRGNQYVYRLALTNCYHTLQDIRGGRASDSEVLARLNDIAFALALEAAA